MKFRTIANWIVPCIACALIITNRIIDMPILGWIGDVLLIFGSIMLIASKK